MRLVVPRVRPALAGAARPCSRLRFSTAANTNRGDFHDETDYVVLGAGSAGCVMAARLSGALPGSDAAQSIKNDVMLLEAGGSDQGSWDSWKIQMPAALTYNLANDKYNWDYHTTPQTGSAGRSYHCPRGRVLGGSSSLNAMVYVRGHALDFERWQGEEGAEGWGYADVLPYFRRAQTHALGAGPFHGGDGPLHVRTYQEGEYHELFDVFVAAGLEAGYAKSDDLNGERQEGFGPFDMTIGPGGERWNTSNAYLRPALSSGAGGRIDLRTRSRVRRIIFDEEEKKSSTMPRAIGVEYENIDTGALHRVRARKEVILSLGAIGTPQTLLLSGVGPAAELEKLGITPIVDSPEVGRNLQDHTEVYLQYLCHKPVTLFPVGTWRRPHRRVLAGIEWFLRGSGPCATNHFNSGGFIRTRAGLPHPDIQFHFIPGAVVGQMDFLPEHAFQVHTGTLRPRSRGTVRLASSDPREHPLIDPNYYDHPADLEDMRSAVRLTEEIVQQSAFDGYRGERLAPGPDASLEDDDAHDEWIRSSSHSAYHVSCTAAIGRVVDPEGRVYGTEGLRVVDASAMPSMTSGNLNAPTIMMAEKLADSVLGVVPEAADEEHARWELPLGWETQQRGLYGEAAST